MHLRPCKLTIGARTESEGRARRGNKDDLEEKGDFAIRLRKRLTPRTQRGIRKQQDREPAKSRDRCRDISVRRLQYTCGATRRTQRAIVTRAQTRTRLNALLFAADAQPLRQHRDVCAAQIEIVEVASRNV
jgi:hypothetical protein